MDKLKLVKTIVFLLTFLLVFGTLLLIGSIVKKTRPADAALPQQLGLKQPSGSRIAEIRPQDGLLYLLVKDGGLSDRIIILDASSGKILSTISVN
ncbi:MAG: hypothetical protein IJ479_00385 [Alphaproteobacteria bacterium]|nr:hypothetical protein [Alphaproteobacteria bacterium]